MIELEKIVELAREAEDARNKASVWISGYKLGAAVLTSQGNMFSAGNFETQIHTASIHAEVLAIAKAVQHVTAQYAIEKRELITALAVCTPEMWYPCGLCLQVLSQFAGDDCTVIACNNGNKAHTWRSLNELLPHPFRSSRGETEEDKEAIAKKWDSKKAPAIEEARVCPECVKRFSLSELEELENHMLRGHDDCYTCPFCGVEREKKYWKTTYQYKEEVDEVNENLRKTEALKKTENSETRLACPNCESEFTKAILLPYRRALKGGQVIICPRCNVDTKTHEWKEATTPETKDDLIDHDSKCWGLH